MKRLIGIELSHQKAPLAIREKISMSEDDVKIAAARLKTQMPELFIVSTCNRLAVYALTDDMDPILDFFRQFGPLDPYLEIYDHDMSSSRHLFATASGLESQAIGEHEILGQLKKAYSIAQEVGTIGPVIDEMIRRAIFVGKKVRKETAIGQYPVSLASVSYDVLRNINKDFSHSSILVLGTGEMSNLMLKIISKKPFKNLYIVSRSMERAESMQHIYGGTPIHMDNMKEILPTVDVIIGATNANDYVLNKEDLENDLITKTLIDLGMPRNFDPEIKTLEHAKLFDLDDLKSMTKEGMQKRQEEIPHAMDIVNYELGEFAYWLNARQISPIISSYYGKLDQIKDEELKWALPKLGNLDENQQKIIENLLSRVTRRVSGKPIERLRQFSQEPHIEKNPIDTFKELFDL